MSQDKTSNQAKAPICAAFVEYMREVFGEDVKVLYVKEGEFQLGEPTPGMGIKDLREAYAKLEKAA